MNLLGIGERADAGSYVGLVGVEAHKGKGLDCVPVQVLLALDLHTRYCSKPADIM